MMKGARSDASPATVLPLRCDGSQACGTLARPESGTGADPATLKANVVPYQLTAAGISIPTLRQIRSLSAGRLTHFFQRLITPEAAAP
jgi:hypothetical protein